LGRPLELRTPFGTVDVKSSTPYTPPSCAIPVHTGYRRSAHLDWTARAVDSNQLARTWQAGRGVFCPPVFGVYAMCRYDRRCSCRRPSMVFPTNAPPSAWTPRGVWFVSISRCCALTPVDQDSPKIQHVLTDHHFPSYRSTGLFAFSRAMTFCAWCFFGLRCLSTRYGPHTRSVEWL
jgi:hypothetical protein